MDREFPTGMIEPHELLLSKPLDGQLIYKIMTVDNFLKSILNDYLYFNRVDSYSDFQGVDISDGEQTPLDRIGNKQSTFMNNPEFSAAGYYDKSRQRTYASCFSTDNSEFIWENYGNGSKTGKVCLVFDFAKLRDELNQTLGADQSVVLSNGVICRQIFSVNYGLVDYVDWEDHVANSERLPNPISYTYIKDARYSDENELRISLSALGIGNFVLADGQQFDFSDSLHVEFNYRKAVENGTLSAVLCEPSSELMPITRVLPKLAIKARISPDT